VTVYVPAVEKVSEKETLDAVPLVVSVKGEPETAVPLMVTLTVPEGAVVPVSGETVTVMVSLAPTVGVVVVAETSTVVPTAVEVLVGHAVTNGSRFKEPRPVTRS
jgi:hypothetical protein